MASVPPPEIGPEAPAEDSGTPPSEVPPPTPDIDVPDPEGSPEAEAHPS